VTHRRARTRSGLDVIALLQPGRGHDVTLAAVDVVQQCDPGGAVRVLLDVRDLRRYAVLVVATEVDQPEGPFVAAPDVAGGDSSGGVTPTARGQRPYQRL